MTAGGRIHLPNAQGFAACGAKAVGMVPEPASLQDVTCRKCERTLVYAMRLARPPGSP